MRYFLLLIFHLTISISACLPAWRIRNSKIVIRLCNFYPFTVTSSLEVGVGSSGGNFECDSEPSLPIDSREFYWPAHRLDSMDVIFYSPVVIIYTTIWKTCYFVLPRGVLMCFTWLSIYLPIIFQRFLIGVSGGHVLCSLPLGEMNFCEYFRLWGAAIA